MPADSEPSRVDTSSTSPSVRETTPIETVKPGLAAKIGSRASIFEQKEQQAREEMEVIKL